MSGTIWIKLCTLIVILKKYRIGKKHQAFQEVGCDGVVFKKNNK